MAIDRDEIYNRFITALELSVGNMVAQVPDELGNNTPAIYRDIDRYPISVYPFIAVSVNNRRKQQNWAVDRTYEEDGTTRITTIYDYFITVNIHSGVDANKAHEIGDQIEASFVRRDINQVFRGDGFAEVSSVGSPTINTYKKDNQVKGFSNLVCTLTITDVQRYTEDSINTVNAGLHLRQVDSDADTVSTTITTED